MNDHIDAWDSDSAEQPLDARRERVLASALVIVALGVFVANGLLLATRLAPVSDESWNSIVFDPIRIGVKEVEAGHLVVEYNDARQGSPSTEQRIELLGQPLVRRGGEPTLLWERGAGRWPVLMRDYLTALPCYLNLALFTLLPRSLLTMRYFNLALGCGFLLLSFMALREVKAGSIRAAAIVLVAASFPMDQLLYAIAFTSHGVNLIFIGVFVWCFFRWLRRRSGVMLVAAAACCALGTYCHFICLWLPLVAGATALAARVPIAKSWRSLLAAGATFVTLMLPWAVFLLSVPESTAWATPRVLTIPIMGRAFVSALVEGTTTLSNAAWLVARFAGCSAPPTPSYAMAILHVVGLGWSMVVVARGWRSRTTTGLLVTQAFAASFVVLWLLFRSCSPHMTYSGHNLTIVAPALAAGLVSLAERMGSAVARHWPERGSRIVASVSAAACLGLCAAHVELWRELVPSLRQMGNVAMDLRVVEALTSDLDHRGVSDPVFVVRETMPGLEVLSDGRVQPRYLRLSHVDNRNSVPLFETLLSTFPRHVFIASRGVAFSNAAYDDVAQLERVVEAQGWKTHWKRCYESPAGAAFCALAVEREAIHE